MAKLPLVLAGLMQDVPLLISNVVEHAAAYHRDTEIVSQTLEGPVVRTTFGKTLPRVKKLANALTNMGIKQGDRVATLACNTYRHLELYYAVTSMGAVLHTLNIRLSKEHLLHIINHAEDQVIFMDMTFLKMMESLVDQMTCKKFVILTEEKHMPFPSVLHPLCYESLLAHESTEFKWPLFDERTAAALCYTSGTTGDPKGVLYSHRSSILHSWAAMSTDGFRISSTDTILVVVPMFHVNAWGLAHAAAMAGAKLVLPANQLDGGTIIRLMNEEQVTLSTGVPTVWLNVFQTVDTTKATLPKSLNRVVVGGTAAPRTLIERFAKAGVQLIQIWGMTETSPIGVLNTPLAKHKNLSNEQKVDLALKQGRGLFGLELKVMDEHGNTLPRDGHSVGQLMVRGPWVASAYFKRGPSGLIHTDGWMFTGDMATIDEDGYLQIADRAKDMIKSGGEWISSIDLENLAMTHPGVFEAAVVGIKDPKWDERPLLIVVKKNKDLTKEEIMKYLEPRIAKWWLPDDIVFVDELPHQSTGKVSKLTLRKEYQDYKEKSTKISSKL